MIDDDDDDSDDDDDDNDDEIEIERARKRNLCRVRQQIANRHMCLVEKKWYIH